MNLKLQSLTTIHAIGVLLMVANTGYAQTQPVPNLGDRLTAVQVSEFAALALKGMNQEYPNKPSNVMTGPESVLSPREMFPAFYGCFDWHSSIHGHWMLVRLIRLYPGHPREKEIRERLDEHLTPENLAKEAEYFGLPHNKSFERMYGWGWAFRLVAELHEWNDPRANVWRENLRPLEQTLVDRVFDYLPKLTYPVRTGVHPDTGFALGQILDYSRAVGNSDLESLVVSRARDFYLNDKNYPLAYEPSGEDFFSSGLNEADLMRRVLNPDEFAEWLSGFFPEFTGGSSIDLLKPVEVSDVTDGKLVHLAGLDFSRAWCLQSIAAALPEDDPRVVQLIHSAEDHAKIGFGYVFSGSYEGEHWLATFAVYALTRVGIGE